MINSALNPLFCHDKSRKNYRVSWDTPRAPNTNIPEHILRNMQIQEEIPVTERKPLSLPVKIDPQKEEADLLAEAMEGHWLLSNYTEETSASAQSSPIPSAPDMSQNQMTTFARELEENPCSSYFICRDEKKSIRLEEYLQRTNDSIYHLLENPSNRYGSAKHALTYFQNRFRDFSPEYANQYVKTIRQDPYLRSYLPRDARLSSLEQLTIACKAFPDELASHAAFVLMKTLSALEIAELRAKIDFTNIAQAFTGMNFSIDEIFHSGDIVADLKLWIENHTDLLKDKTKITIPRGTQVVPPLLIRSMPNITYVKLSDTDFLELPQKSIKNILGAPRLEHLDLSNNSFRYFPTNLLRSAKNLHTLDLSGNPLSESSKNALRQYCANHYDPDTLKHRPITLII